MNTYSLFWKGILLSVSLGALALYAIPGTILAAAPTVSTLSPADNFTEAESDTNLIITFSESVTATTTAGSFVTIKRTNDGSTVEAIDVSGAAVTGSASTVITINPSVSLNSGSRYYVEIDNDAFFNGTNEYYAGISNSTTWNFEARGGSGGTRIISKPSKPSIALKLSGTAATVYGSYSGNGTDDEVGFAYADGDDETTVTIGGSPSTYQYHIKDLACGTTYTFEGYAKNTLGVVYSDEVEVATEDCDEATDKKAEEVAKAADNESEMPDTAEESTSPALLTEAPEDLFFGSSGLSVTALQTFLITQNSGPAAQALLEVGATAYFGPLTKAALAEYQTVHGIAPALGYYGPITRSYIKDAQ